MALRRWGIHIEGRNPSGGWNRGQRGQCSSWNAGKGKSKTQLYAEKLIMAEYRREAKAVAVPDSAWAHPWKNHKEATRARATYQRNGHSQEVKKRKLAAQRKWRRANRGRVNANQKRWIDKRPENRLALNLRKRLHEFYKQRIGKISGLIGCTPAFLRSHIEAQFKHGMTFGNYGEWHIDHVIPCAVFNLSDPAQQRTCFHFTNLQPLWAKDNLSKGARILRPAQLGLPLPA